MQRLNKSPVHSKIGEGSARDLNSAAPFFNSGRHSHCVEEFQPAVILISFVKLLMCACKVIIFTWQQSISDCN